MAFFRVYAVVSALLIAGMVIAYFRGEDRRYLRWAIRTLVASVAVAAVFFAILVFDRVTHS